MSGLRAHGAILRGEGGSAALEFILVGLVLLIPIVYLIVALGVIQGSSLGAEAGARHAARAVSTAADEDDARARVDQVLDSVMREYDLDPDDTSLSIECSPEGDECPRAGAILTVTVRTTAALPLVPPVLGLDRFVAIPIEASGVHRVSRTWTAP